MIGDNGWLPLFRNKIFLRKKEVMFTFCYCIPNNSSLLSRWKCPFVSFFKQKKKMFTFPSSPKIYISLLPIFLFRSRLLFFHCFMARLHAQFYIGKKQQLNLYVELCRDEFKGGGFITFWVLENTKFHTFKKCIRKYLPCNVITSTDGWAGQCYVFSAAYWSNQ